MGVDAFRCNLQARRVENALAIALQAGANLDDLRAADPDVPAQRRSSVTSVPPRIKTSSADCEDLAIPRVDQAAPASAPHRSSWRRCNLSLPPP